MTTPLDDRGPASVPEQRPDRAWLVVALGLVVSFAILIPLAIVLDRPIDRARPMYEAVSRMAVLQGDLVDLTGSPKPLTVGPGESVRIAGRKFTSPEEVTIEVRATGAERGKEYCVQGTTSYGDVSDWECGDGTAVPE